MKYPTTANVKYNKFCLECTSNAKKNMTRFALLIMQRRIYFLEMKMYLSVYPNLAT